MFYKFSFESVCGHRDNNEDFVSVKKINNIIYAGIFDGHGGRDISRYCSKYFLDYLSKCKDAHEAYISFDKLIKENILSSYNQGSTAVCVSIDNNLITVSHCGDSRCIIGTNDNIVYITRDHKPNAPEEQARILDNGGFILGGRIYGSINISRAFGDYTFKTPKKLIIPDPTIYVTSSSDKTYVLLHSDGLYYIDNNEMHKFILYSLSIRRTRSDIVSDLINLSLYRGSRDNISICLLTNKRNILSDSNNMNTDKNERKLIMDLVKINKTYDLPKHIHFLNKNIELKFPAEYRIDLIKSHM